MSYFNNYLQTGPVKTIVLRTPEECLRAGQITKELIEDGNCILPSALYPNEVHISYVPNRHDDNVLGHNVFRVGEGNAGMRFSS